MIELNYNGTIVRKKTFKVPETSFIKKFLEILTRKNKNKNFKVNAYTYFCILDLNG